MHETLGAWWRAAAPLRALAAFGERQPPHNFDEPHGPRYAGCPDCPPPPADAGPTGPLRLVTFNIEFARRVDQAIALLAGDATLRDAGVLLLQEMTADATRRVADALGLWHVYYPAVVHGRTRQPFGNAVLSRWPIVSDAKLVLPHRSRYAGTQRTATVATIGTGRRAVRVYSVHLGTVLDVGPAARRAQLAAVLADAAAHPRVIIGGDLNSARVGRVARDGGYHWPTERAPWSTRVGRLDHIFLRGLGLPAGAAAGVARDAGGASDHRPVWAVGVVE